MAELEIKNLNMSYDKHLEILKSLNLHVKNGELISILGPSGCGKTTTLRIIAGLLRQTDGQVLIDGKDVSKLPVHKRNFGMVFQSYALFPHLNVFDNVAFGLRQRKEKVSIIQKRVNDILIATGLKKLEKRFPDALSGGQQQRVSLARALVVNPKLLLLDEPLSNLDAKLRVSMREEIRRLQQLMHTTTVFVTHDQEECFAISDRVAVMNQGVIEQFDTPQKIYRAPKTVFVARFIGYENFLSVTKKISSTSFYVKNVKLDINSTVDGVTSLSIRPNQIVLGSTAKTNIVSGEIQSSVFLGNAYRYTVSTCIGNLKVDYLGSKRLSNGQNVQLELPAAALLGLKK
ncbi:ABC transporter ATP-binding protein [Pediococcus ethanolidurans]|uniref:Spermidine putrescine ABC transporter ATP-binding protein n=1 Tax=Pediococcus ethanolidurans TaxID=319653 RepID=A0A0R2K6X6_9LACO|nr:ABC transporter ATP-binding protein [Pediococcus ethanolidurans]KRN83061.1 spermidine putrescine ABC transporter ATP-binding protein [Pediococcus ethanolidurans]GEN94215.1 ABC transporter ATP-binding protein [Pediococcus ethanolidurans]SER09054.1 putative spermidine/putrescine transport system ATP-binding protein [Pediococcus ethanolidurans]